MILEILAHLVALDIGWFINLVISNPFWVMIFAVAGYFLMEKKAIFAGTLLALYIHSTVDVGLILGWTFQKGFWFVPVIIFFGLILFFILFGLGGTMANLTVFSALGFVIMFIVFSFENLVLRY